MNISSLDQAYRNTPTNDLRINIETIFPISKLF